jgi:hypothetical protein
VFNKCPSIIVTLLLLPFTFIIRYVGINSWLFVHVVQTNSCICVYSLPLTYIQVAKYDVYCEKFCNSLRMSEIQGRNMEEKTQQI